LSQQPSSNEGQRSSRGREVDSQGRLIDTDKWDNHNAIARGWKTVEDNYHPVTFRKIYGVDKQVATPVPPQMQRKSTPRTSEPAAPLAANSAPAEEMIPNVESGSTDL